MINEVIEFEGVITEIHSISFENFIFYLKMPLVCKIENESNYVYISNDFLNINVWDQNEEAAFEAFSFTFFALYENYYNEVNQNLTDNAIKIKDKLHSIIKEIIINEN